jgi:hypothetical protein
MEFELKPLHVDAVAAALEKAKRYRLLNEPGDAESICLDVLAVEPDNQEALQTMLLAITDQFEKGHGDALNRARAVLPRLESDYEQLYFAGLVCERQAKAKMRRGGPGAGPVAYEWFREAMEWYEKAEAVRPAGNDDALLRWNACARRIVSNSTVRPAAEDAMPHMLE